MNQRITYTHSLSSLPFAEMFTFSAKEKDAETGFSVTSLRSVSSSSLSKGQTSLSLHSLIRRFGSRYYSSDLSIWLSVDPQASKYPSLSPYVYCADNPVKLVDPNGEELDDIFGMGDKISNDSWKYKYESTAAAGGTVFMRLTKAWKDAHHTEKWHGGR